MNITPLIIGILVLLLGVAAIVFRKPFDRFRDARLASRGEMTELTIRMLRAMRMTIVLGCIFVLFGLFAIVAAFFPLARS